MNGKVDNAGRSLLGIELRADAAAIADSVEAWVDTGFTGDLVLPQAMVDQLLLSKSGSVDAILADGSQIELATYTCLIHWFGSERKLEVVANAGDYPLLGVGLLLGRELRVDFRNLKLTLTPVEKERSAN